MPHFPKKRDIFDLESLSFAPPDIEVKNVFPVLYLLGNTIYMKSDYEDASGVDGTIVNVDMYPDPDILFP